ncbi:MAG TPA: hypothetical protein VKV19_15070 [Ktedonobacteraceae bacterium]|nr:hypothetical protein [Ktedonobacteraceae bacterium]
MDRRKRQFKLLDYSQPTEPVESVGLPPTAPVYPGGGWSPDSATVPAPHPKTRPMSPGMMQPPPYMAPYPTAAYPVLPPPPYKKYRGTPPGGAAIDYPDYPDYPLVRLSRWRRSPLPGLVGAFFVLVQLMLLVRVGCILFNVQSAAPWFTLLVAASNLLVSPMHWLVAKINLTSMEGIQLFTDLEYLLAILAYGLFSRLLVRLLRAVLNR